MTTAQTNGNPTPDAGPAHGPGGLRLHRAARSDRLAGGLADLLASPPQDPFTADVVAVPTPGIERWLAQSLAARLGTGSPGADDGVCAGVQFPTLADLVDQALAAAGGGELRDDPWRPRNLVWPLLSVIDEAMDEAWFAPVAAHLGGRDGHELRPGRRYDTAVRLARLFGAYARQRPQVLRDWRAGRDTDGILSADLSAGGTGTEGAPLPEELRWQPVLWRALAERIGAAGGASDPVAAVDAALAALRRDPARFAAPERLSVFGITRLSDRELRTLQALAAGRDVHLWMCHPSPALWQRLQRHPLPLAPRSTVLAGSAERSPRNRVSARLGRDLVELQAVLHGRLTDDVALTEPDAPAAPTLLQVLQRAVRDDLAAPAPEARPRFDRRDDSVQVHASHGLERQVEVLRELLTGLLQDDLTLEPRDIVVLCPDIERFAPLITANFGLAAEAGTDAADRHPGQRLRVRLADRSMGQINPLLALLRSLFELSVGRCTATDLVELCAAEPVARRFGFTDDDVSRIAELVERSGIRWGMDAQQRREFGMGDFAQNTWLAGLDRMLTGVALSEDDLPFIGLALPLDDVDSGDIDLVGRLTEVILRVRATLVAFGQPRTLPQWTSLLRDTLGALSDVRAEDAWQVAHAHGLLARLGDTGTLDPPPIGAGDLRALLLDALRPRASRSNFRTGALTVCTLSPMRSVPHRVVCLLGLDDGSFPRAGVADGDDVLARRPVVGEQDRRSEDRQLLLDAVLSAQDKLLIVYGGHHPRTGEPKPPSVPVQELLDGLDALALGSPAPGGTGGPRPIGEVISTVHSLQAHAARNFESRGAQPLSFDRQALQAAVAVSGPRRCAPEPVPAMWPPHPTPSAVALEDLIALLKHPARAFLRERLGLSAWGEEEDPAENEIPLQLNRLDQWALGDRMLQLGLSGVPLERAAHAEWLRGRVPPRALGARVVDEVRGKVEAVLRGTEGLRQAPASARSIELSVTPPDLGPTTSGALRLTGTVGQVRGEVHTVIGYSRPSANQLLPAWVRLLALSATRPEVAWRAVVAGPGRASWLGPVPREAAVAELGKLLGLYRLGLAAPLPLPPRTALAVQRIAVRGANWKDDLTNLRGQLDYDCDADWETLFEMRLDPLMAIAAPAALQRATGKASLLEAGAALAYDGLIRSESSS